MFTGILEEIGKIRDIKEKGDLVKVSIETDKILNTQLIIQKDFLIAIFEDTIKAILLIDGKEVWSETYSDQPIYQAKGGELVNFMNLIYFILPNNIVGSIDVLLGERHLSNFDNLEIKSSINNTNDKLHIFDNYLVYLDEGEYLYTFDILLNEFTLYKHKITFSRDSREFINNALIIKNENYLQAFNINNGNVFWKIDLNEFLSDKEDIIEIINNKNNIVLFFNQGNVLEIDSQNGNIIFSQNLKIKHLNSIDFFDNLILISQNNGKALIFKQ